MGNGVAAFSSPTKKSSKPNHGSSSNSHISWNMSAPTPTNKLSAVSASFSSKILGNSLIVEHYMPPFCIMKPELSVNVGEITKKTWEAVASGNSEGFQRMKNSNQHISALTYFYDRFYDHLFYLYPEMRKFFQTNISHQGKRLIKSLMGLATMVCYEKEKVHEKLLWLTDKHSEVGIHPQYYGGFMWNILMTLRHCLGSDWTFEVEEAWITSASYMLRVMVPQAVQGTKHFASPYACPKHEPAKFEFKRLQIRQETELFEEDISDTNNPLAGYVRREEQSIKNELYGGETPPTLVGQDSLLSIEEHFLKSCSTIDGGPNTIHIQSVPGNEPKENI